MIKGVGTVRRKLCRAEQTVAVAKGTQHYCTVQECAGGHRYGPKRANKQKDHKIQLLESSLCWALESERRILLSIVIIVIIRIGVIIVTMLKENGIDSALWPALFCRSWRAVPGCPN